MSTERLERNRPKHSRCGKGNPPHNKTVCQGGKKYFVLSKSDIGNCAGCGFVRAASRSLTRRRCTAKRTIVHAELRDQRDYVGRGTNINRSLKKAKTKELLIAMKQQQMQSIVDQVTKSVTRHPHVSDKVINQLTESADRTPEQDKLQTPRRKELLKVNKIIVSTARKLNYKPDQLAIVADTLLSSPRIRRA